MVLKGKLVEMMTMVDPNLYRKHATTYHNGHAMLYAKIHTALYGLLRSALLFYRKLVKDSERYGFELNLYDPCFTNKMISGSQMTVT